MSFVLDPRLAADSVPVLDGPLCSVRLFNDARYPWCLLIPRLPDLREIHQLAEARQQQLWRESSQLGAAMMRSFDGHKLNVAALGNVVPQLHVHHIVRFEGDDAWPAPVWGRHPARPYDDAALQQRLAVLRAALDYSNDDTR